MGPPPGLANFLDRQPVVQQALAKVKLLFEFRPIWSQRLLTVFFNKSEKKFLKRLLPMNSYNFSSGLTPRPPLRRGRLVRAVGEWAVGQPPGGRGAVWEHAGALSGASGSGWGSYDAIEGAAIQMAIVSPRRAVSRRAHTCDGGHGGTAARGKPPPSGMGVARGAVHFVQASGRNKWFQEF